MGPRRPSSDTTGTGRRPRVSHKNVERSRHRSLSSRGRFLACALVTALSLSTPLLAQSYTFSLPATGAQQGGLVSVPMEIDATAGVPFQGFSASVCVDPQYAAAVAVEAGVSIATINGGGPPNFFSVTLRPDSFSIGVVFELFAGTTLPAGVHEVLLISYGVSPTAPLGVPTPLAFCTAGTPPIENVVTDGAVSYYPAAGDGSLIVIQGIPVEFIRGDCNGDGEVTVTDVVVLFQRLFLAAPIGACPRAGDVNSDGVRDIADVVFLIQGLLQIAQILPPYPLCGPDFTPSSLACQPSTSCP